MQYLIESAFCLTVLYGFYWFVLRKETFFQWNRWYLLLAPFLAFAIPAIQIQLEKPPVQAVVQQHVIDLPIMVEQAQNTPITVQRELDAPVQISTFGAITIGQLLQVLYRMGAVMFGLILLIRMWKLFRFIRKCRKNREEEYTLTLASDDEMPVASFFSFVFWHKKEISEEERLIIEHELVHARQWHSLDVLFMELLVVWQWFNPLIYLYRRSLQAIHEYIADDYVVRRTKQRHTYANLLAQQYLGKASPGLVNTFHTQLKDRLLMLAKHPSNRVRRAKFALAFPLAFGLMLLFSFRLIERIPGAAPMKKALRQTELFTQRLAEITITTGKPESVTAPEPTPYIFYWGGLQVKLMQENGHYTGEIHLSPTEFREAVKREPRLWNGQSMEQHLSLDFKGIGVRSDYEDESVYVASRKAVEPVLAEVKDGDEVVVSKIGLPGGKTASVKLLFDQGEPGWLTLKTAIETYGNLPTEPRAKASKHQPAVLWKKDSYNPVERQFCTVSEFWSLMASKPRFLNEHGDSVAQVGYSVEIRMDQDRIKPYKDGFVSTFDSLLETIQQHNNAIRPGVHVSIEGKQQLPEDMVFILGEKFSVTAGSYTIGIFDLVPDGDPRLKLRYRDRTKFNFEWGNYSQRITGIYGNDQADPYNPNLISEIHPTLTVKEVLDMVELPSRLFKEQNVLRQVRFALTYKDKSAEIADGICPPEMVRYIKNNLQPNDKLVISDLTADQASLRTVFKAVIEVKPNSPKAALRKAVPTATGSEQAFRLFPPTPNPATDNINLAFYLPGQDEVTLTIANLKGQIIWTRKGTFEAGNNSVHLRTADLQGAGMYVVTLQTGGGQTQEQLVVQ